MTMTHRARMAAQCAGAALATAVALAACSGSSKPSTATTTTARTGTPTTTAARGGPGSTASPLVTAGPSETTPADIGKTPPCTLLTLAQVTSLLAGASMKPGVEFDQANGPLTIRTCRWAATTNSLDPQNSPALSVTIIEPSDALPNTTSPTKYFNLARQALSAATPVPGLGDQAFELGHEVYVLKRGREITVLAGTGPFAPLQVAEAAARQALAKAGL